MGAVDPGPGARNRSQHLQRRHLRPGRRRLHGDLDPDHRHRHHQGRRSRVPGGDRRRRRSSRRRREKRQRHRKGNITQNAVSMDQQQLAPTRSSAFMSTTSDAHGTTIQGSGPDAGVFRYQATLSRLATHLHLHRAPGERPGRKRTRSRDAGPHRARGHAAQPGHRAEPSTRHPGQLRALPAKIRRHAARPTAARPARNSRHSTRWPATSIAGWA